MKKTVYVSYTRLRAISASGGGNIASQGALRASELSADANGGPAVAGAVGPVDGYRAANAVERERETLRHGTTLTGETGPRRGH